MTQFIQKIGIYFVLIISLVLRLVNINQSLWLDEAISALVAKSQSISGILEFIKGDNHPPLFYLLLKVWGSIIGFSDVGLRLLPVIFGVLTIFVTYLFFKRQFNQRIALIASLFLATSPLHIYYSQELRMYSMLAFWIMCLVYMLSFLEKRTAIFHWIVLSLLIVLIATTDYVGLFFLPVIALWAFLQKFKTREWIKLILAFVPFIIMSIFSIPLLFIQSEVLRQQASNLPGWKDLAGGATAKEVVLFWLKFVLGRISFDPKKVYFMIVGFFSIPIIYSFYQAGKKNQKVLQIWGFLLIPLAISFVFSFIAPAFNYYRFIYLLPAFYGLIAIGINNAKKFQVGLIFLILLGNLIGSGFYFFDQDNQREQWKQTVAFIESENPQLVLFEFPNPFDPYRWYSSGKVEGFGALNTLHSNKEQTNQRLDTKINLSGQKIMYVSYLRDLTDPDHDVENKLQLLKFNKTKAQSFIGVGEVAVYERN